MIGNDLIDLRTRDAQGKARDVRFVRRVFTSGETARIESSPRPDRTLWILWAGKEAAFKVARKLRPGALFAHAAYEVSPELEESERLGLHAGRFSGRVALRGVPGLEGVSFPVEWELTESFVHCVAMEAGTDPMAVWTRVASLEVSDPGEGGYEPSERESASARTAESLAVRRLARALAREVAHCDVEIVREPSGKSFGPPQLYPVGGAEPLVGWDVSLSHDAELAAVVLAGPGAGL